MATSAAVKRAEEAEAKAERASRRIRDEKKESKQRGEHLIVNLGAAFALGYAEKKKMKLPTVGRVDPKALYGAAALVGAYMSKDKKTKRILNSAGDGALAIVAYESGKGVPGALVEPASTQGVGHHHDDAETHVVEEGEV